MNSLQIFISLQCYFIFGYCQEKGAPALVLSELNGRLSLTTPINFNPETQKASFKASQYGKTYLLCNTSEASTQIKVLNKVKEMQPLEEFDDAKKCEDDATTELMEMNVLENVNNDNMLWDMNVLEFRQSGYLIQQNKSTKVNEGSGIDDPHETAQLLNESAEDYLFFTLIYIIHHKEKDHTIAVQYELYSTDLPYHETFFNIRLLARLEAEHKPTSKIFIYAFNNSPQYVELFEGKISTNWLATLKSQSTENPLTYLLFANTEHFPLPLWREACTYSFNVFPIWRKSELTWNKVDTFARIVAKHLGNLTVTTGITGNMTLSGEKVEDKYGFQFPKYIWKVLKGFVEGKIYAILIVLNYNPFEKTEKKLCEEEVGCEINGWIISNDDFQTGEVYCCKLSKRNIVNLEADYLNWQERKIFNLHEWEYKSNIIKEEFTNDILHRRNPIKIGLNDNSLQRIEQ